MHHGSFVLVLHGDCDARLAINMGSRPILPVRAWDADWYQHGALVRRDTLVAEIAARPFSHLSMSSLLVADETNGARPA